MIMLSDKIPPQEYEKKRDMVIELLKKRKDEDVLMSLLYLNDFLKLDEYYPPAYAKHSVFLPYCCGNSTFQKCFTSRYNLDIKAKFLATFSQMVTIPSEHDKI